MSTDRPRSPDDDTSSRRVTAPFYTVTRFMHLSATTPRSPDVDISSRGVSRRHHVLDGSERDRTSTHRGLTYDADDGYNGPPRMATSLRSPEVDTLPQRLLKTFPPTSRCQLIVAGSRSVVSGRKSIQRPCREYTYGVSSYFTHSVGRSSLLPGIRYVASGHCQQYSKSGSSGPPKHVTRYHSALNSFQTERFTPPSNLGKEMGTKRQRFHMEPLMTSLSMRQRPPMPNA
ncbi:hypothetical protein D9611_015086 [Ephemerocybe angulata]|uniref:Uncharacterized protein n=1 Tax=Ephemerocybe angulata TaxID=980116 RepID=A0A8H5CBR9_9AGAR|nr:hypothetical protein D9611_015086 [Tulosesus angulatus]